MSDAKLLTRPGRLTMRHRANAQRVWKIIFSVISVPSVVKYFRRFKTRSLTSIRMTATHSALSFNPM